MLSPVRKEAAIRMGLCFVWIFCSWGAAQSNSLIGDTKSQPARVCIVLAQPGENQTTALKDGNPLWQEPAMPGYGFGEWTWPGGVLNMTFKNPSREDLLLKGSLAAGKCYLITVDSKPNPDPKESAKYPSVTTAELIPLSIDPPEQSNSTFGISLAPDPLDLQVNGKKITLKRGDPVLFGHGRVLVESGQETISCTEPNDPFVLVLSYFKDRAGKISWINSRFY